MWRGFIGVELRRVFGMGPNCRMVASRVASVCSLSAQMASVCVLSAAFTGDDDE